MGLGIYPWRQVPELTEAADFGGAIPLNPFDKSTISTTDLYGFVDYAAGPLNAGIAAIWYQHHVGPEAGAQLVPIFGTNPLAPLDVNSTEGAIYMKYNNGRFFFNAEGDWYYSTARFQQSLSGSFFTGGFGVLPGDPGDGSGSLFRPRYTEWWRAMVELGAICGPAKLSLLWSWIPGPDRRHGVLIDRQPVLVDLYGPTSPGGGVNTGVIVFSRDYSNNTVFRPYSIIFNNDFGSGLGATSPSSSSSNVLSRGGDGYIVDANVYAARLDYAVASNLNVFGSFLYATRISHGYGWGYIKPTAFSSGVTFSSAGGSFTTPIPAIPDNSLGWEVDAGVSWNLLENWLFDLTAGYWQPGKWFNFACISKTVPAWDVPTAANNFGTNPDRSIDQVFALIAKLTANF